MVRIRSYSLAGTHCRHRFRFTHIRAAERVEARPETPPPSQSPIRKRCGDGSRPGNGHVWFDLRHSPISCDRSEEHTSELQSLMRSSYAVFCLKKTTHHKYINTRVITTHKTQHTSQ